MVRDVAKVGRGGFVLWASLLSRWLIQLLPVPAFLIGTVVYKPFRGASFEGFIKGRRKLLMSLIIDF